MSKANAAVSGAAAGASVAGPWGAAIGAIGGYLMGSDDPSSSMYEKAMKLAETVPLPVLEKYYPELAQNVVRMNPELATAVNLGPSQMEGISTDPALRQAQLNALMKLQEIGVDGQTAQDELALMKTTNSINSNNKGQQDAIMQNMAMRGTGGGGTELAARMAAAQASTNTGAEMAMQQRAQAEERALQALMQSGQLGGQMQAQDFSQQSAKAQAQDAISRFNAQNQQQVMNNNVGAKNSAQMFNAQNAQNIANQNTQNRNQANLYNLGLNQQQYDNQMKKLGLVNSTTDAAAKSASGMAANQNKWAGDMITSGAKGYAAWDAEQKKTQQPQIGTYSINYKRDDDDEVYT